MMVIKKCLIFGIVMIIMMTMAIAGEESLSNVAYGGTINDKYAIGVQALSFVNAEEGLKVVSSFRNDVKNDPTTKWGTKCPVGTRVTLLACLGSSGFPRSCDRILSQDYERKTSDDGINLLTVCEGSCLDQAWFKDLVKNRYIGYDCKQKYSAIEAPKDPSTFGKFTKLQVPSFVYVNEKAYLSGEYVVKEDGSFIMEATIETLEGKVPLSVIQLETEDNACDGSAYFSGKKMYAKKGDVLQFKLIMKAPSKAGEYKMRVYTWTDCYKDGGKQIDNEYASINLVVKARECNTLDPKCYVYKYSVKSCGVTDTDGDSVPNKCDRCPIDKGTIENSGCHPCFGLSALDKCWNENKDKFDIPEQVKIVVDEYNKKISEEEAKKKLEEQKVLEQQELKQNNLDEALTTTDQITDSSGISGKDAGEPAETTTTGGEKELTTSTSNDESNYKCDKDVSTKCENGDVIITGLCILGKVEPTENKCVPKANLMQELFDINVYGYYTYGAIILAFFLVIILIAMPKKRRRR